MHRLAFVIQTPEVKQLIPVALLTGSLPEKINKAAQFGAQGIEFMTTRPKDLNPAEIRRMLAEAGLEAAAVASGGLAFAEGLTLLHADPLRASQARLRLVHLIEFADEIGAPLVTIGSFRGKLAASGGQSSAILGDILAEAATLAERHHVRLVIEPLNRYETDLLNNTSETLSFINQTGHANIGLLLDTFHVNIEESSWITPFQKAFAANRLWHVHLGDNNRLPPGQGLIDFQAILSTLTGAGYNGYLSAELLAKPNPDEAARQTAQYLSGLERNN